MIGRVHTQKIANTGLGQIRESHKRQITLRNFSLHSSRAGRAATGQERKNPVKAITAVWPKPHYPTAAFTASHPPRSTHTKKVKFFQSGIYLFQALDGVRLPRGFVFFGPWCRICFSGNFHQDFMLVSAVQTEQTCLLSMNICHVKSENHYTENDLKRVHEDSIVFGRPPGGFQFPHEIPNTMIYLWIIQIL